MAVKTLETGEAPKILIKNVGNNLQINGWNRPEVMLTSKTEDAALKMQDEIIQVVCPNNCELRVPHKSSLEIGSIGNNARIRLVDGTIALKAVGNSLLLQDVGETTLNAVGNKLSASRVRGDLKIGQIGANAMIAEVTGQVALEAVNGKLNLSKVGGGVNATVGGKALVELSPVSWQAYEINVSGALHCIVPADVDARFDIHCGRERIRISQPDGTETIRSREHTFTLGSGEGTVRLSAGGRVDLTVTDGQPGEDHGLDFEIEKTFARARESLEQRSRTSSPSKRTGKSVSDEEQLMILQMLQNGQISAEQADQLLAALEGS